MLSGAAAGAWGEGWPPPSLSLHPAPASPPAACLAPRLSLLSARSQESVLVYFSAAVPQGDICQSHPKPHCPADSLRFSAAQSANVCFHGFGQSTGLPQCHSLIRRAHFNELGSRAGV